MAIDAFPANFVERATSPCLIIHLSNRGIGLYCGMRRLGRMGSVCYKDYLVDGFGAVVLGTGLHVDAVAVAVECVGSIELFPGLIGLLDGIWPEGEVYFIS